MTTPRSLESQFLTALLIAMTSTIGGGTIGGMTNVINGAVSPLYFRTIMRWDDIADLWRAIIAQGVFEGLIYGTLFALVYTPIVIYFSPEWGSLNFAIRILLAAILAVLFCWTIGGLLGMLLATVSPQFYRSTFYGVPEEFDQMIRYAWVGGSIWGALFGSAISLVLGSTLFVVYSRRMAKPDTV